MVDNEEPKEMPPNEVTLQTATQKCNGVSFESQGQFLFWDNAMPQDKKEIGQIAEPLNGCTVLLQFGCPPKIRGHDDPCRSSLPQRGPRPNAFVGNPLPAPVLFNL